MLPAPLSLLLRRSRRALGRVRGQAPAAASPGQPDPMRPVVAEAFDAEFYLRLNPDVAAAGMDPVDHFLAFGWREGRDPTPDFSLADYRELNPDAVGADENPFVHYVLTGRAEGRPTKQSLGFRYDIIAQAPSMEERLAAARARAKPLRAAAAAELVQAMSASRSGLADFHLTVSHDNYAVNIGGVQLCVQREAKSLAEMAVDHLHLFPALTYPMVREGREAGLMGVVWNGAQVGCFTPGAVAQALQTALGPMPGGRRTFALHSLLGHSSADVLEVLAAAGLKDGFFWIHDFASLCASFHLMRDDVANCGAPPPQSAACSICIYGPYRQGHIDAHMALFEGLDLTVVAPSQNALETWRTGSSFPHKGEIVLPHASLTPRPAAPSTRPPGPLRVAFLGISTAHKGWPIFADLAARFRMDPRYAFVHLGRNAVRDLPVEFHEITVSGDQPAAMKDQVEALDIDVALIWPLCGETFSFTAYEAIAAGAAILTNSDSGNVAAVVGARGHGLVVENEQRLRGLFESGEVLGLAKARRAAERYDLAFSRLTADLRGAAEAAAGSAKRSG